MPRPSAERGDGLKGLAMILAIALLSCAAMFLLPSREADALVTLPVVIRRVMTSNPSACYNIGGKYYDWIELQNASETAVNLKDWRITDSGDLRDAYVFGDLTLQPGASVVVFCAQTPEDYTGSELFTGFKLSSDGELLLLADPAQRISALDVPAMGKTDVYQRDPDTGKYSAVPFYKSLGMEDVYTRSLIPDYNPNGVMISEIMPVNHTVLADEDGDFSDWIELYNPSGMAVNLKGCALSDTDINRAKWVFEDTVMQPGEYLIVFASGKDRRSASGRLHTNFKLSSKGETLRLFNANGDAISYVKYQSAVANRSFSRLSDGSITARLDPSPGYENTDLGIRNAMANMVRNDVGLYINEVCLSGKGDDWVELHNQSDQTVYLEGMGLSDNTAKPRKWRFPAGASVQPGGYVLIALPGGAEKQAEVAPKGIQLVDTDKDGNETVRTVASDYTADFALGTGETLCLSAADGRLLDRLELYDRHSNISIGRAEGHGAYRYFAEMTPGAENAALSYEKAAKDVTFNIPPGIVRRKNVDLEMYSDSDVPIYYTTDGSMPNRNSKVYSKPIPLEKNICIRAIAMRDDVLPSNPVTASFILESHELRLICVTGKQSDLAVLKSGKKKASGSEVYVEMYEPDGTKLIGQKCVLKMVGHHSRTHYAQKSFKLTAKRATGDTRFRAALFSNRDYDEYKAVVMRASGQDVMQTKMRDSILTTLAADTSVLYQETEVCVVYVNGTYWGLYNMREHIDTHSICQFEGWSDPDNVNIVEGSGNGAKSSAGSSTGYKELLNWVRNHDLTSDANVESLRSLMDIENYLDYVILEMYTCNQDLNNVRCYNSAEDPRWKWALFDLDLSFQVDRNNILDWSKGSAGTITSQSTLLFRALMRNDGLRDRFLTRFGELLAGPLASDNVNAKIQARIALIRDEMTRNCKRWSWKISTWEKQVQRMSNYATSRPAKLVRYLAEAFNLSDAQTQLYFGAALEKANG